MALANHLWKLMTTSQGLKAIRGHGKERNWLKIKSEFRFDTCCYDSGAKTCCFLDGHLSLPCAPGVLVVMSLFNISRVLLSLYSDAALWPQAMGCWAEMLTEHFAIWPSVIQLNFAFSVRFSVTVPPKPQLWKCNSLPHGATTNVCRADTSKH